MDTVSKRRVVVVGVVLCLLIAGLWAIGDAVSREWVVPLILVFGIIATIPWLARAVVLMTCAAVVALIALVGFNVLLGVIVEWLPNWLVEPHERLPIKVGLVVALVVFGGVAHVYLVGTWARAIPEKAAIRRRAPFRWLAAVGRLAPIRWVRRRIRIPSPGWPWPGALAASAFLAVAVIIVAPIALTELSKKADESPEALPVAEELGDDLDVLIITDHAGTAPGITAGDVPANTFLPVYSRAVDLDVRYSVGVAHGRDVAWTNTGIAKASEARAALESPGVEDTPPPKPRPDADSVIVLVVDGTPPVVPPLDELESIDKPLGDIARWKAIATSVRAAGWENTPVYALLQTTDDERLGEWGDSFARYGGAVSVQQFGSQSLTDSAVRLGVATPTAQDDFWLAMQHRPILLFDRGEAVPRPLSIEQMFKDGRVRQCADLESDGTCGSGPALASPAQLRSPGMHLVIAEGKEDLQDLAKREEDLWKDGEIAEPAGQPVPAVATTSDIVGRPGAPPPGAPPATAAPTDEPAVDPDQYLGQGSRIYVHPVSVTQGSGGRLLYLDYWWYLPENPAGAAKGAFCGAGLVMVGVTCFDHQSDWEGVTVVLERPKDAKDWKPSAVQYAQHEAVVRYDWDALRAQWRKDGRLETVRERIADFEERPVVFVASGTHASYARRCRGGCHQVATDLEENHSDGGRTWVGDDTAVCLRVSCLLPLPTASGGRGPASWNAFSGPWGKRRCAWTYYCDSGTPPAAPGQQDRYLDPARFDGRGNIEDGGYDAVDT